MQRRRFTTRVVGTGIAALAAGFGVTLGSAPSVAVTQTPAHRTAHPRDAQIAFYDARQGASGGVMAAQRRAAARVAARPQARALRSSLGDQALLDIDPTTGTVRLLARLDGYLTGPSQSSPGLIARRYVKAHHTALGLTAGDLNTFLLRRDYRDVAGTHHLSWTQRIGGVDVFGNGLTASVTKTGRLLTVGGSPVTQSFGRLTRACRGSPRAPPRSAPHAATSPSPAPPPVRATWPTRCCSSLPGAATSAGRRSPCRPTTLPSRSSTRARAACCSAVRSAPTPIAPTGSTGRAFNVLPEGPARRHAAHGRLHHARLAAAAMPPSCRATTRTPTPTSTTTRRQRHPRKCTPPRDTPGTTPLKPFHLAEVSFCDNPYPCSWNPDKPFSWRTNRAQNAAQVFFFVNKWHDHLKARADRLHRGGRQLPEGERAPVRAAAATRSTRRPTTARTPTTACPTAAHIDNANMDTPPDGQSPTMQMYLQHQPGTSYPDGDPFSPDQRRRRGGHGLPRVHPWPVEPARGRRRAATPRCSTCSRARWARRGATGTPWTTWSDQRLQSGRPRQQPTSCSFQYDGEGVFLDRTEPIDCKVGSKSARCTGGETGHRGGYTYADYGTRVRHSRRCTATARSGPRRCGTFATGSARRVAESLVTRAHGALAGRARPTSTCATRS